MRRVFETTSSTLHGRDGKAVYINRYIAPWSFDRNAFQDEIKQLSGRFGESAREMRLPSREGVQAAMIAVWGKIQLTELDADAISILASGESPRKGLLIDYLGNLRRSAQQGLPIYSLSGGAGYIWSASVGRNNVGHIRVLTVDPSALSPAAAPSPAPAAEAPPGEVAKIETAAAEKPNGVVEPPPVEPESTSVDAGVAKNEIADAAAPEGDKIAPLPTRPETDLGTAEANSRTMQKLAYGAVGGLIVLLVIAASLLLAWRKTANATKAQAKSETQPARQAVPEQKLAAVIDKNNEGAQPASASVTSCLHCNREISVDDKFCLHCGASVAPKHPAATTQLCSSCRQEIGASDRFCRHCGASSISVVAPSMTLNAESA